MAEIIEYGGSKHLLSHLKRGVIGSGKQLAWDLSLGFQDADFSL